METTPLNIFILDEHALVANGLRRRLQQKFGSAVTVTVFCDVHQCLKMVDNHTHVLVLDHRLEEKWDEVSGGKFNLCFPQPEVLRHDNEKNVMRELSAMLRHRLVPEAAAVFAHV